MRRNRNSNTTISSKSHHPSPSKRVKRSNLNNNIPTSTSTSASTSTRRSSLPPPLQIYSPRSVRAARHTTINRSRTVNHVKNTTAHLVTESSLRRHLSPLPLNRNNGGHHSTRATRLAHEKDKGKGKEVLSEIIILADGGEGSSGERVTRNKRKRIEVEDSDDEMEGDSEEEEEEEEREEDGLKRRLRSADTHKETDVEEIDNVEVEEEEGETVGVELGSEGDETGGEDLASLRCEEHFLLWEATSQKLLRKRRTELAILCDYLRRRHENARVEEEGAIEEEEEEAVGDDEEDGPSTGDVAEQVIDGSASEEENPAAEEPLTKIQMVRLILDARSTTNTTIPPSTVAHRTRGTDQSKGRRKGKIARYSMPPRRFSKPSIVESEDEDLVNATLDDEGVDIDGDEEEGADSVLEEEEGETATSDEDLPGPRLRARRSRVAEQIRVTKHSTLSALSATSVKVTSQSDGILERELRSGKIVRMSDASLSTIDDRTDQSDEMSIVMEQLADEEDDEEVIDVGDSHIEGDDLDLAVITLKSLLKYKRDVLTRLCEERELDVIGNKNDLAKALIEWRDRPSSSAGSGSDASAEATAEESDDEEVGDHLAPLNDVVPARRKTSRTKDDSLDEAIEVDGAVVHLAHQEEVNALDLESLQLLDKEINPDLLTKLEKIGSGGFKDVYRGIYRKKTVAIADIRGHLTEMDLKELAVLRDLRHPNIVNFIGVSIPRQPSSVPVAIVTELCANGDLFDYLRGVPAPPFSAMLDIMLGIANGLNYLHTRTPAIIHRDMKSSNVLITSTGAAKINDFGLARVKTTTKSMIVSLVGTVNWQAMELWVAKPRYSEKVDVYSTGLVFWEVLQWHQPVKRYPFEGLNEHAIYVEVGQRHLRPSTASMGRQWGIPMLDLVNAMWTTDPSDRPSMAEVVVRLEAMLLTEKNKVIVDKRR